MSILVVGSVAYDTVETPFGRAERVLGGSAAFFSVAASFFSPVNLVGVVGEDFGEPQLAAFGGRPIDLEGLERMPGKTFHWQGKYSWDLNSRDTICTDLNVFEFFKPKIPARYRRSEVVFLGNIDPVLQRDVLDQVEAPRLVACDTMNFWIGGKREALVETLGHVDILIINEGETRQLAAEANLIKAARAILALGPKTLVIKRGEYGVLVIGEHSIFSIPAYPLEEVFDPTGAGDTFAGGFIGYLAATGNFSEAAIRKAAVFGSVMASFTVEQFSLDRLRTVTWPAIEDRFRTFQELTVFEGLD
jgi:sugar/nucleoside kinase (ribokinase family)